MSENKKTVSFAMAIVTLIVVAGIMSVGLAILKLNTMVTFILTFLAVCVIAVCVGTKLNGIGWCRIAPFSVSWISAVMTEVRTPSAALPPLF